MKKSAKKTSKNSIPKGKKHSFQTFLTSLYFLSEEAEREDFSFINQTLRECISKIDAWAGSAKGDSYELEIVDESLFECMTFLHKLLKLSPSGRKNFIEAYIKLDEAFDIRKDDRSVNLIRNRSVVA